MKIPMKLEEQREIGYENAKEDAYEEAKEDLFVEIIEDLTVWLEAYLGYMKTCGKQVPGKVTVKQKQFEAMLKTARDKDVFFDLAEQDGKLMYRKVTQIVSV